MSARDVVHGRRAGRWASAGAGHLAEEVALILQGWRAGGGRMVDHSTRFHPEVIAQTRAHVRDCKHPAGADCKAVADPDDLEAIWAGRARMARARKTAGRPLDRIDNEALFRAGDQDHA